MRKSGSVRSARSEKRRPKPTLPPRKTLVRRAYLCLVSTTGKQPVRRTRQTQPTRVHKLLTDIYPKAATTDVGAVVAAAAAAVTGTGIATATATATAIGIGIGTGNESENATEIVTVIGIEIETETAGTGITTEIGTESVTGTGTGTETGEAVEDGIEACHLGATGATEVAVGGEAGAGVVAEV